MLDDGDDHS